MHRMASVRRMKRNHMARPYAVLESEAYCHGDRAELHLAVHGGWTGAERIASEEVQIASLDETTYSEERKLDPDAYVHIDTRLVFFAEGAVAVPFPDQGGAEQAVW